MPISTQLTCSQCGGELHPDEGQRFLTCPYCSATVYLDKSRVVLHWYVAPTIKEQDAVAALYRWMSGSQTVKDLDKKARVEGQTFQYFPVWYFKWKGKGSEQVALQPAAATSVSELASLKIPAGDLRKYDADLDAQSAPPSVPLESGLEWVKQKHPQSVSTMEETSIVHIPLYFFKYVFGDQTYTAVVDAASGTVMANLFPAKRETPYQLVGGVTALVFLCLAMVPLALWGSLGSGALLICGGTGIVAAGLLFAWAYWVASKI
jgi:DNA-directed RNA polymerase subunit RPC12/RpoP